MLQNGQKPIKRAAIYARCSTDESRQDVELQLAELRRFCQAFGWEFDEYFDYGSGWKEGEQPKLQELLEKIKRKHYDALVVYSMCRLSRAHPSRVNRLLDSIVYEHGCRFIARQESVDSDNELVWNALKGLFSYFAFTFSRQLSERVKLGIKTKKEKGLYRGGRPSKQIDVERLKMVWQTYPHLGWRLKTERFNEGLTPKYQISVSLFRNVCKRLSFGNHQGNGAPGLEVAQKDG